MRSLTVGEFGEQIVRGDRGGIAAPDDAHLLDLLAGGELASLGTDVEVGTEAPGLRASRPRPRPGVRRTPGITAAAAAPGAPITVMPGVGTTLPRARATAHLTSLLVSF